jgi:nucleoside-diphosphate-sugar epimerase
MSKSLVLLTGATGFVGFKTLVLLLEAGYHVRAAVRSESKKNVILATKSIQDLNSGASLSWIIVPDLTIEGAYDEAVSGVTYVVHIASPMVKFPIDVDPEAYESELIRPPIDGTVGILRSIAKRGGEVKRVVITSSAVTLSSPKYVLEEESPLGEIYTESSTTPVIQAPFSSVFHAYNAGKIAASVAAKAFMAEEPRTFDVVQILPSFILGKNELATRTSDYLTDSNAPMMAMLIGNQSDQPVVGATVHIDDVAYMHVKSLDLTVPAGAYIANSDGYAGSVWQNGVRTAVETFPEAVAQGILKTTGVQPTRRYRVDNSLSEKLLEFRFQNLDSQVKSLVGHYLELLNSEKK